MSDYSFMKSGFSMIQNDNDNEEERLKQISSIVFSFTEYAMKNAGIYVEHSKRNCITKEDVRRCLMNETFIYLDRQDNMSSVQKWQEIINEEEQKEEEEYEDEDEEDNEEEYYEDEEDEFSLSKCECKLCKNINEIHVKWEQWVPSDGLETSLKKAIDLTG